MVVRNGANKINEVDNMATDSYQQIFDRNSGRWLQAPSRTFHCGVCGRNFSKSLFELNHYGLDLNCPTCNTFIDGEQDND